MNVGDSVRKAIDDWMGGEHESSMLHACNAIDGTAGKLWSELGNKARFTKLLRENYAILGPMGAPGINLNETVFPVPMGRPTAPGGKPDIADVIYGIHRCTHGHGDELPKGFELLSDAAGPPRVTRILIERGKVRLSDRVIFGMLAIAVLSAVNVGQTIPSRYFLTFDQHKLYIYEWWGRAADFHSLAVEIRLPNVKLDFRNWESE